MRSILISVFIILNLLPAFGQNLSHEQQVAVSGFIDCIKNQKKDKLSSMVSYPLWREYPLLPIKNKQEFIKRYDEVFDEKLTKMIVNSDPMKDWSEVGWRGITLSRGDVWLDDEGRLIAVNYQSAFETETRDSLIRIEKSNLHASIRTFSKPVMIMETSNFRIRIDDMGDGNYRYASWKIDRAMSEKPDLVILNGKFVPDGSGGNHSYEFVSGGFRYECEIIEMGESDSPPGRLKIFQNGSEILSQNAKEVLR
jgi:hypothetical protein